MKMAISHFLKQLKQLKQNIELQYIVCRIGKTFATFCCDVVSYTQE